MILFPFFLFRLQSQCSRTFHSSSWRRW